MGILDRQNPEVVDIDGIPMPKLGCLTIREMKGYTAIIKEIEPQLNGTNASKAESNLSFQFQTISLLLKRLDPDWTLDDTLAEEWTLPIGKNGEPVTFRPDYALVGELHEFFEGESRRWQSDEEIADSANRQPGKSQPGKRRTLKSA